MTRELLQQALDKMLTCWPESDPLVKDIRAHLALPQGEPVVFGCKCPVCDEWQRSTPSGMVCKNGHGGETGINHRLYTHPAHTEQEVQEIFSAAFNTFNHAYRQQEFGDVVRRILGVPPQEPAP